jgi:hypothetical protein
MSEVITSQPPPATDGGAPWGSFYTASGTGAAPTLPKPAEKVKGRAKRKRSAEPKPEGESKPKRERKLRRSRGSRADEGEHAKSDDAEPKERRRSFSLRRASHTEPEAPAPATVAPAAQSRRYAEPHVLVGVVGGTLIALYALAVALLYMIGNAA